MAADILGEVVDRLLANLAAVDVWSSTSNASTLVDLLRDVGDGR